MDPVKGASFPVCSPRFAVREVGELGNPEIVLNGREGHWNCLLQFNSNAV
jgi:hypothetical protein